jgi:hypothetical protein
MHINQVMTIDDLNFLIPEQGCSDGFDDPRFAAKTYGLDKSGYPDPGALLAP